MLAPGTVGGKADGCKGERLEGWMGGWMDWKVGEQVLR